MTMSSSAGVDVGGEDEPASGQPEPDRARVLGVVRDADDQEPALGVGAGGGPGGGQLDPHRRQWLVLGADHPAGEGCALELPQPQRLQHRRRGRGRVVHLRAARRSAAPGGAP